MDYKLYLRIIRSNILEKFISSMIVKIPSVSSKLTAFILERDFCKLYSNFLVSQAAKKLSVPPNLGDTAN